MRFSQKCLLPFLGVAITCGLVQATPVPFDLPAQSAATALLGFAKQADAEILFASSELKKINTTEVRGTYEPERAIDLLLSGTGFMATREATGKYVVTATTANGADPRRNPVASLPALREQGTKVTAPAGKAKAIDFERIVELPPLTVSTGVEGLPWRYLKIPGFEILSRSPTGPVVHFAREMVRLHQWLRVILPDDLRVKSDVPTAVVLYDTENKPELSREVVADMTRASTAGGQKRISYRALPNMRLADKDAMVFFFVLDASIFDAYREAVDDGPNILRRERPRGPGLMLRPEYVHYLAKSRTPALPAWFVEGVVDLFEAASFSGSEVLVDSLTWLSPAETLKIRKFPENPPEIPPLAELFASTRNPERLEVLRNEALLFIRWGLDGKNQPRREALWKFIRLASTEPVTEKMFSECFGYDYAKAEKEIGEYLPTAVSRLLRLVPKEAGELPSLNPELATKLDIARIKGDWDRLEINYVRARYPELTEKYVEQARRTLRRAYDQGERDPRLLAVMGLCECDAGDDAAARPYLEAAVRAGVVRPRANYELARLRYAEARSRTEFSGGKLSAAEVAAVLQPLAAAYRQQPHLLEAYALSAEVWARSEQPLTRRELDLLGEGVEFFPWNAPFLYQVAWLNAQHGFKAEAEALIERGLKVSPNPAFATRFEQLRAALAAAPARTGAP